MFRLPACSVPFPFIGRLFNFAHSPSQGAVSPVKGCRAVPGRCTAPQHLKLRSVGTRAESPSEWDPAAAANARRMRQTGLNYSTAFLLVGAAVAAASGGASSRQVLISVLSVVSVALLAYTAWLFEVHNGMVSWVWHSGRLHIETDTQRPQHAGVPPPWIPADAQSRPPSVDVKWAGEPKGYGAFAGEDIPAGTLLGCYEGELLNLEQYYARYPEGVSDYCITVDSEFVIDGAARALDRENFSCCHINHSSTRFNVSRRTLPREQCVQIFTNQDIRQDDELLLDYGRQFWTNREQLEQA